MELELIRERIYTVREMRVMLDFDLAELYNVETRTLKQSVRRNLDRFPDDFMFQLSKKEWNKLIKNYDDLPDNMKYSPSRPFAFSEQGVAMLSSVLKSKKAIQVNILIMRAFVMIRKHLSDYQDLKKRIQTLEEDSDSKFNDIYEALNYLIKKENAEKEQKERKPIGF